VIDRAGVYELYGSESGGSLGSYSYHGQGTPDPTGASGWHPNFRNIISGTW
jgi:hypothetical protein